VVMNDKVEQLLASQDPQVADLAREVCGLVLNMYPDAVVSVDGGDIGFGTGSGYKGLVFVVSPHSNHVTLGLVGGAGLPDPARLMEGKGKVHRHVKIRQSNDLTMPALRDLMTAALAQRG
jgi:Domain of unknown function (DU1801)